MDQSVRFPETFFVTWLPPSPPFYITSFLCKTIHTASRLLRARQAREMWSKSALTSPRLDPLSSLPRSLPLTLL